MSTKHSMQPMVTAPDGIVRFQENPIVRWMLEEGNRTGMFSMDTIGAIAGKRGWTDDDQAHFAQLIGYSLCGYSELDYVSEESYDEADKKAEALRSPSRTFTPPPPDVEPADCYYIQDDDIIRNLSKVADLKAMLSLNFVTEVNRLRPLPTKYAIKIETEHGDELIVWFATEGEADRFLDNRAEQAVEIQKRRKQLSERLKTIDFSKLSPMLLERIMDVLDEDKAAIDIA